MLDSLDDARVVNIGLNKLNAINRLHLGEIHGDDRALLACAGGGDLRPSSWSRTQIDHGLPSFEQCVAAVDLVELEGGARAIILRVGSAHEGVAPVSGEPAF